MVESVTDVVSGTGRGSTYRPGEAAILLEPRLPRSIGLPCWEAKDLRRDTPMPPDGYEELLFQWVPHPLSGDSRRNISRRSRWLAASRLTPVDRAAGPWLSWLSLPSSWPVLPDIGVLHASIKAEGLRKGRAVT